MKLVARVATNDGTFNITVISPLIIPIPAATTSAATIAHPTGTPSCHSQYMTQGVVRNTCPAERSISPSTSTSTSPTAIAPTGPAKPAAAFRLREVTKLDESMAKKMNRATVMMVGVTSRCATKARQR